MREKSIKRFKTKDYPNIQVEAGTVNREQLKACYLELKGTFETNEEDKIKSFNQVCRKISTTIDRNINTDFFRKEFIMVKDISDTFVMTGRSYTKMELTFFMKRPTTFDEVTVELNQLLDKIWTENIQDTSSVKFHKNIISKRKSWKTKKEIL